VYVLNLLEKVKWVRMLYNDFSAFARDQQRLISTDGRKQNNALNYLEGQLLMNQGSLGSPGDWRLSFFPSNDHSRIISLIKKYGIIYCLEVAKYYDDDHTTLESVDQVYIYIIYNHQQLAMAELRGVAGVCPP
jgi:cytokinin dehydrogenase